MQMQTGPNIGRWSGCSLSQLLWNIILFFLHFLKQPHEILFMFYPSFSGLLPLAVMCPCKVLHVFLVVLKGSSGVGVSCVSWANTTDSHVARVALFLFCTHVPQAWVSYSHWPWFPLLCNGPAASAGYSGRCSPALELPNLWSFMFTCVCVCVWRLYFFPLQKIISF